MRAARSFAEVVIGGRSPRLPDHTGCFSASFAPLTSFGSSTGYEPAPFRKDATRLTAPGASRKTRWPTPSKVEISAPDASRSAQRRACCTGRTLSCSPHRMSVGTETRFSQRSSLGSLAALPDDAGERGHFAIARHLHVDRDFALGHFRQDRRRGREGGRQLLGRNHEQIRARVFRNAQTCRARERPAGGPARHPGTA
jgi:hypothetical protein